MSAPAVVHRDCCHRHFRKRAWERYGLALAAPDIAALAGQVAGGTARWIRRGGATRDVYELRLRGRAIFVVYDSHLEAFVTALPPGWARHAPAAYHGQHGDRRPR